MKISFYFNTFFFLFAILFTSCDSKNDVVPFDENGTVDASPLNFFEDDMVGKWSRYHDYDGSTKYYIFNDDRTACYWEQIGSSRRDKKQFVHWELKDKGNNEYAIMVKKSPTDNLYSIGLFKYVDNEIWKGGYSNLKMSRSNTSRDCE